MDIIGNLSLILPIQSGVSQQSGNQWQKATFVLDQQPTNPNYPAVKKACISTMNASVITALQQFPLGTPLKVAVDVESREYNGKWYTEIRAFKIEQFLPQQQAAVQQGEGAASVPQSPQGVQGGGFQQPVGQQMPAQPQPQFAAPAAPAAPQQPAPQGQSNDLPF